ncbi:MAG: class I SAM-dependent methyltransferase [Acidimicrobiales bacterium]
MGEAERRWAEALAGWEIPEEIRRQASADPWQLPPSLFPAPAQDEPVDTPARHRALEALPARGTVLDVGVGGGAASLPLAPPATLVVGVDQSADMLAAFARAAEDRGIAHQEVRGPWPEASGEAPVADVVVSHHVLYNVPGLAAFATALTAHARHRVVVEITGRHPVTGTNGLWRHFWDLQRPEGPTADDAVSVLLEAGIESQLEREDRPARRHVRHADRLAFLTRRLCLHPERQPEVEEALAAFPEPATREYVTLSWPGTG